MKLAPARVAGFLRDPGACRVVLLYGDDSGMIRDRAEALVRAVAGSLDDPFLVAELAREALPGLADEAASLPLTGGRRVVRVREAGDAATAHVRALLKRPAAGLVVLEAGSLPARSSLRVVIDESPDCASIGCYPEEGKTLTDSIRTALHAAGVGVDPDALSWLASQLGADRAATRAELEKLALYVGPGGRVDLAAAMECVGDLAGLSLDDALYAATEGDVATADRALELAMNEGAAPVQVLRAGLMHLQRLHRVRLSMDESGMSASEAVKAVRPPLFYRRAGPFTRALGLWSSAALGAAIAGLADSERSCKRTGWPDETLSRNAILAVARRAAMARGGGGRRVH
jgi:DNA polymerase-3 subunit delta